MKTNVDLINRAENGDISAVAELVRGGFSDWKSIGDVNVNEQDGLFIFNYTQDAQFSKRWNGFERLCRGLIIDIYGGIRARAFNKFFNWGEGGQYTQSPMKHIWEKVDGSLGILYTDMKGKLKIATRGSFNSEQAKWATNYFQTYVEEYYRLYPVPTGYTVLFEIVFPENRLMSKLVVDYGKTEELVLLAIVDNFTGASFDYSELQEYGEFWGLRLPAVFRFNNITQIIESCGQIPYNEEGYVVEFFSGERFKFKGDRYTEMHRLINNITFKNILQAYKENKIAEFREIVPDEFMDQFNSHVAIIEAKIQEVLEKIKNSNIGAQSFETRKAAAMWINANHKDIAHYLFKVLDNQFSVRMILDAEFSK